MNTIIFNKNYTKLPAGIKTAVLVACEAVRGENQTETFIKYDTFYVRNYEAYSSNGLQGDYLCLVLKSDSGAIFTTLRKDNRENREKYMIRPTGKICGKDWEWGVKYDEKFQIIVKEG